MTLDSSKKPVLEQTPAELTLNQPQFNLTAEAAVMEKLITHYQK